LGSRLRVTCIKFLGIALVALAAGCAGDNYNRSTGESVDDTATTARVKRALSGDGVFRYPDVKVTTFKGTVQLSGFVQTGEQKDRATELAKKVEGVKDVENRITVK
jgi:hyperosmotically inducible protein